MTNSTNIDTFLFFHKLEEADKYLSIFKEPELKKSTDKNNTSVIKKNANGSFGIKLPSIPNRKINNYQLNNIKSFFANKDNYEGIFESYEDGTFYYQSIINGFNIIGEIHNSIIFLNIYKNDHRFDNLFSYNLINKIYQHEDPEHFQTLLDIMPINVFKHFCLDNICDDANAQDFEGINLYENSQIFYRFNPDILKEIKEYVKQKIDNLLLTQDSRLERIMNDSNTFYAHLDYIIQMKNLSNIQNINSKGIKI